MYVFVYIYFTDKCNLSFSDESSSSESFKTYTEKLKFDITFSVEEWISIQPKEKVYIEKRGPRMYNMLFPFDWSNVVQDHFFLHTKLPCCLTFKKAKVSLSSIVYVSLVGRCNECGSIFNGTVDAIPAKDSRYYFSNVMI